MNSSKRNKSRKPDVVVAGLAVVDIIGRVIDADSFPKPGSLSFIDTIKLTSGGNVSNVGIDLSKMGLRVAGVTRVGEDELGRFLINEFKSYDIDVTGITIDRKKQTSSTVVCVARDGERSFLHTRGCLVNFSHTDILSSLPIIQQADLFAFGYLGLLPEMERRYGVLLKTIKEKSGAAILLDTGGKPAVSKRSLKTFLPYVDYFIPSYEEAVMISGIENPEDIIAYFRDAGSAGIVCIKMGKEGCIISDGRETRRIGIRRVRKVADTTGAGDAFVAGFIAATLRDFDPFRAAAIGTKVAADCITQVGASTAIGSFEKYSR
jgi:sugar/nucleoside kinase (ribokinase family)